MTHYYLDPVSGSDANNGTSVTLAKASHNGAEDVATAGDDIVHVRQGTYRELWTLDQSGTSGHFIEYRVDLDGTIFNDPPYTGARVTGSANDQTASRAQCILGSSSRTDRKFVGYIFDGATTNPLSLASPVRHTYDKCFFAGDKAVLISGASQSTVIIQNSYFAGCSGQCLTITHTVNVDNTGHIIQNCVFAGTVSRAINTDRVGGITVRNCVFNNCGNGVRVGTALTAAQTVTVNNCLFHFCSVAVQATALGEIVENFNNFWANATDRTTVNVGANSIAYLGVMDARWFMRMTNSDISAQLITPYDLASYSQLINMAGTSPTTTDMRGIAVQGAQREFGPLEYDTRLKLKGGIIAQGGTDMPIIVKPGTTSLFIDIFIQDATKGDGSGLTGLVYNATGLVAYYARTDQGNAGGTVISLATMTRGTWATGGFVEKDATNLPGVYEFSIPNAVIATGSNDATILLKGAASMVPKLVELSMLGYVSSIADGVITAATFAAGALDDAALIADIADSVWDETAASHTTSGTTGALLNLISSISASGIAASVWNYLVSALGATTTVGGYFKNLLDGIKAKTDTLGASAVTVTQPVVTSATLSLTQGDDYLAVDGRALDFTYSGLPDFTSGSAVLKFTYLNSTTALLSVTGSIYSSTTVRFQPTRTETALLPVESALQQNQLAFEIQVTLADASVITPTTLQAGRCTVSRQAS